jgi:hypothetical protein
MDITCQLEADGSCVRFAEHSVAQEFVPAHDLEARGGCLRLFATSWQKRPPRELKLRTLCDPIKPPGGQKVSAT